MNTTTSTYAAISTEVAREHAISLRTLLGTMRARKLWADGKCTRFEFGMALVALSREFDSKPSILHAAMQDFVSRIRAVA